MEGRDILFGPVDDERTCVCCCWGVVKAGNKGNGGKEGTSVCLNHGTSANILIYPFNKYSSMQTLRPIPCSITGIVMKLPVRSV